MQYKVKEAKKVEREQCGIDGPKGAHKILKEMLANKDRENLALLCLNCKGQVVGKEIAAIGSLDSSIFSPRELIRSAIKYGAYQMIIGHNHPSGDPYPSDADLQSTALFAKASELVGIQLLDHLVLGDGNKYASIRIQKPEIWSKVHWKIEQELSDIGLGGNL